LQTLETYVVSTQPAAAPPAPSGRVKKSKGAPPPPDEPLLECILHDTVLFPEGGGQPSDIGLIVATDDEGNSTSVEWEVIEIKRRGGTAVHFVKAGNSAEKLLVPEARVKVSLGKTGFARRLDHVSSDLPAAIPLFITMCR
jgi:misacylated tRNA(Ala) deacylase